MNQIDLNQFVAIFFTEKGRLTKSSKKSSIHIARTISLFIKKFIDPDYSEDHSSIVDAFRYNNFSVNYSNKFDSIVKQNKNSKFSNEYFINVKSQEITDLWHCGNGIQTNTGHIKMNTIFKLEQKAAKFKELKSRQLLTNLNN